MSSLQLSQPIAPTAAAAHLVVDHRPLLRKPPQVEVIVKRRRFSSRDGQGSMNGSSEPQPTHSPRIYRIAKLRLDERERGPQAEAFSREVAPDDESITSSLPCLGKRMRRVLNGRVTIIRPMPESEAVPPESVESHDPQQDLRDRRRELGPFRMGEAAERRYDRLMKAIQRLEIRAAAARKAETAAAVRWIRRTMARYDIRACEVGA